MVCGYTTSSTNQKKSGLLFWGDEKEVTLVEFKKCGMTTNSNVYCVTLYTKRDHQNKRHGFMISVKRSVA